MIYVNVDSLRVPHSSAVKPHSTRYRQNCCRSRKSRTFPLWPATALATETEGASFGMGMINLIPWDQRDKTVYELMKDYEERVSHIKDADIQFFLPPTVPGFGNASGFELRLQDKTSGTFQDLDNVIKGFIEKLEADPRIEGVSTGFNPNFPQYMLKVDLQKAAKLGINIDEAMETLQSYIEVSIPPTSSVSARCTR